MKVLKIVFFLSIIVSLGLFIHATDTDKIIASLQLVGSRFFYLIAVTFAAYLCGTIAWQLCLDKNSSKLNLANLFLIRHISEVVTLLNPASVVGGEAVKVSMLSKSGVPKKTALTSVIISRALMVITQILLFIVAALFVSTSNDLTVHAPLVARILLIVAACLLPIWFIAAKVQLGQIFGNRKWYLFLSNKTALLRQKLQVLRKEVAWSLANNKQGLIWSAVLFSLHWLIGSFEFFVILKLLGIKISVLDALFLDMGVIFFKAIGAFVPAQVGFEEYGNKIMLSLIGIGGNEIWITVSLLRRLRQLFWILLGILFYAYVYRKNRQLLSPG